MAIGKKASVTYAFQAFIIHLAIECHPGVRLFVVFPEFRGRHRQHSASGPCQVFARLGQPYPVHQGEAGSQCHLVPGVACRAEERTAAMRQTGVRHTTLHWMTREILVVLID